MRPPDERAARRGVDRRRPDRHDRRRWILAVSVGEGVGFARATTLAVLGLVTGIDGPGRLALAAALAWALGMMPSTLGMDLGEPVSLIPLGVGGVVLLTQHPRRAVAGARATGPILVVAALYVMAGVLMAVACASLTAGVARSLFLPGATPRAGTRAGREPGD